MDHRQDGGLVLNQCSFQLIEGKPLTPGLFNGFHLSAIAAGHVSQTQAEISLHRHQNGVSRLDGVGVVASMAALPVPLIGSVSRLSVCQA